MTYGSSWQWYASNAALVFVLSAFCEVFGLLNSVWPLELYAFLPLAYAVVMAHWARDEWRSEQDGELRSALMRYRELYASEDRSAAIAG